ncbi:hypothetical protein RRG08_007322, partial [Elysia crispata]
QSCKRKAEDDLTERPRKIIVTEGQSMETDGLNQRDIDNVRKAMWRQRRKQQPKLPISRMDALRAISEIETRQDVKIVTDDETQIACVYSPSAMIRDGPSRPAKLSDRKKHDWMKSSIADTFASGMFGIRNLRKWNAPQQRQCWGKQRREDLQQSRSRVGVGTGNTITGITPLS